MHHRFADFAYKRLPLRAFAAMALAFLLLAGARAAPNQAWPKWVAGQVHAVNVLPSIKPADLDELQRDWGANAVRVQVLLKDEQLAQLTEEGWSTNRGYEARLRGLLDAAASRGMGVVLDLHRVEGGAGHHGRLWREPQAQDRLVALWRTLAEAFKGHPALIGYDLVNEPTPSDDYYKAFTQIRGTIQDWNVLARRIVAAIRAIDRDVPLIVESTDWAKPFRFRQLELIDDPYIVYSFHMYSPFELTHQGVNQFKKSEELTYPGYVKDRPYDRDELVRQMSEVVKFVQRHNVPIFVGEFGINKFAPADARQRYIADLLGFFSEQRWSWAYHAFQIWDGWMPHDGMRQELKNRALKR